MERMTYSVQQASEILGISSTKMYELCRNKVIPNIQVGKRYVIPIQPFIDWILNPMRGMETNER